MNPTIPHPSRLRVFAAGVKKLTQTLTLLCVLSVSALNVFADNKVVTSGTETEANQTYAAVAVTNTAALLVTGSATSYNGTNLTLSSTFTQVHGAYAADQSQLALYHSAIIADSLYGYGVYLTATSAGYLEEVNIATTKTSTRGIAALQGSRLIVNGGTITTSGGGYSSGVYAQDPETVVQINDTVINTSGERASGATAEHYSYLELNHAVINCAGLAGEYEYGGALVAQDHAVLAGNNLTVVASAMGVVVNRDSAVILHDSLVTVTGTAPVVRVSHYGHAELQVNGGTLAALGGDDLLAATGSGAYHLELTGVDTSDAGGIATDENFTGTATVNLNGGSGLNGDLTNSGSGLLTVNLDHSTLTGDVANQGDGALVIILDNNSIGTGGFNGGNLITGSDSAWTFDKDSHGNYGQNDGVWNIGDYEVIFDNLTHTGTVNLSVNSDTGEGGSITVTGTADGEGTVHINTTGDGKLNPNDVLPGIVSGDGTEHWQWDPIDWGIDTIIKDGDHFIKQGTSPAGAVLNSSVAIQQAMWFAQQNSLLKRMGELRYGPQASRLPAGGTPALHNLIENIWIRSYGQQLNVGSQVSGKAYEQLIYGVDLGTDHKFTISADSDLYLGIYAGYGRSDLDYRTPGADGEINSYYGGLYATWLHSSGFYIDATFKAASVNNDLKAPYGNTQLTASYSDVNLGGSLEIGKKFTFADDWFIEPQFQVNYLHILAEDYTAGPMTISAQDLDALQFRIGSLFGRIIKLTNSGALQPYVKISGVETISSGGVIRNGYQHIRANTDGARAELGGGLIWQLDANNQLHLDYEASFGDKYDKPWGLSAGYRHQF
ncbi:MAG: autotransporter outer membrane beta-barrel domain-containing protein [Verrucomicrobiales bacterium]|jgi:outer membrane autotransporter protein|nr:autotransporter outer membrane beta-barrel domain-containing protein [Verrucomicrobiales bacterium]